MIFESMTLENFRQFKDKETIIFSTDAEKNISVILGDNTSGKTTLLNAFKWALYQKNNFLSSKNKAGYQSLLNKEKENEMRNDGDTAKVRVVIRLRHEKSIYVISTSQEFTKVSGQIKERPITTRVTVSNSNANEKENVFEDNLARRKISSILNENLSDYFFFDTENINTITKKDNLSDSIKEILQLNISEFLIEILNSEKSQTVVKYLNTKKIHNNNESTVKLIENRKDITAKIEEINEGLKEAYKNLKNFEELQVVYDEDLSKFKKVETTIIEKEKTKQNIETIKDFIKKEFNNLKGNFSDYDGKGSEKLVDYLMGHHIKKTNLLNSIIKIEDQEKGYENIQGDAVDNIINLGICICGTPIVKGSHAYNHLIQEKKKLPPLSFSSNLAAFSRKLSSNLAIGKLYQSEIQSRIKQISDKQKAYFEESTKLSKLEKDIEKSKVIEISKLQKDLNDLRVKISEKNQDIGKLKIKIETLTANLNDIEKKLVSAESDEIRNNRVDNALAVVKKLYSKVKINYDEKLTKTINMLEEETTNVYNSIYHGKSGKIKIDEKFNATIIDSYGRSENDPGAGRNAVMNFSFVTGIVKLAKEKIDKEDQQIYPLVMDAPLSLLDEKHINNLITVLPSIIDQVIIFVMDKDWEKAGKRVNERIGKKYYIKKQKDQNNNYLDTYSKIEEAK